MLPRFQNLLLHLGRNGSSGSFSRCLSPHEFSRSSPASHLEMKTNSNLCGCAPARSFSLGSPLAVREGRREMATSHLEQKHQDKASSDVETGLVFNHERHNMYVCWHPEVTFPYEMTKPIDVTAPVTNSNLKIQALTPVREVFRKKYDKLLVQELVKLTYSTKHRFFGMHGKRARLAFREMDKSKQRKNREYL